MSLLHNIWHAPDSPLDGAVVGSARPFKDIKLPYAGDVDSIFSVLQQNLTAVKVTGTVRESHVAPISLSEAGDTIHNVILGEVEKKK